MKNMDEIEISANNNCST